MNKIKRIQGISYGSLLIICSLIMLTNQSDGLKLVNLLLGI